MDEELDTGAGCSLYWVALAPLLLLLLLLLLRLMQVNHLHFFFFFVYSFFAEIVQLRKKVAFLNGAETYAGEPFFFFFVYSFFAEIADALHTRSVQVWNQT